MAWRENEFPAAPKRPEGSGQPGGMSSMAQTVRDVQDIQEMMKQVRSLKDELAALKDSVKDDMTGLTESVASMDDQARAYLKSRDEIKRILKDYCIEYTLSNDVIKEITKNFAQSLDDHLKKVGENHNDTLKEVYKVFSFTLQKTFDEAKGKVNEIEERVKKTTSTDDTVTIRHKWLYWAFVIFILGLTWGIYGFSVWYKQEYGMDGMNVLAWATVIAIASVPVYSIIRLFRTE